MKEEQEQWTVHYENMIYWGEHFVAIITDEEQRVRIVDFHNTSLRALQEELAAAKQEIANKRDEITQLVDTQDMFVQREDDLLAACKAKDDWFRDELVRLEITGDLGGPREESIRRALALQPDSSVKPEQEKA